jgi:micrococcal nuclease
VTVSRVVDGNTIEISPAVEGVSEVRLIGADTRETKDPNEEVEPFGPEAPEFATSALQGQEIGVELDVETTDRYGRLLAYVYLGDEMFNETLVEEGYAQTWFIPPNTLHEGEFLAAQDGVRASLLGIWGLPPDRQRLLANHGNGIGEGEPGCAEEAQEPQYEPQYEPNRRRAHRRARRRAETWTARISLRKRRPRPFITLTLPTRTGWTGAPRTGCRARA